MICTIFVPHDAFAKKFKLSLSESLNMSTNDKKPKDTGAKKDAKKDKVIKKATKPAKMPKTKKIPKSKHDVIKNNIGNIR